VTQARQKGNDASPEGDDDEQRTVRDGWPGRDRHDRSTAARNAVDGPTAQELADAFRSFDADDALNVAVLTGAHGTFCAGADLKAVADGRGNRVVEEGDGPMGPSRLSCFEADDRRGGGLRRRGRARAVDLVRPPRRGRGRGLRRVLSALGRAVDRRRHRSACRGSSGTATRST
jgi:hypothetical protein